MNRIICVAVLALGLMLSTGGEAKANGFTFNPGSISLTGSIGVQWQGGGWTCFNNGNNCAPQYGYQQPMPQFGYQQPMPQYGYPMYGYGYGY